MGTLLCFFAVFSKGNNCCDFLLATLEVETLTKGVFSKRKEFVPRGAKYCL